jgi:PIN domain nuclease of toxin-antitoxin system
VILLDTHVLIWLASEPARLSKKAGDAIRRASQGTGIAISAITLWELAWLATHDRLEINGTVEAFVEKISSRTAIRPVR